MRSPWRGRGADRPDKAGASRGQILPLFALALVALFTMLALLLDGAHALSRRRTLQNAGDAAALAAANVIQASGSIHACSPTAGPPPGAPRADVVAAVMASLALNLPGFNPANVTVSCPSGYDNQAVRVDLRESGANFLAQFVLGAPISVGTTSVAVNGQITGSIFSVVELDPSNLSWPNGRRGCPSFLLSGGPTVIFDGSIQVNSSCTASNGGAFSTNGNAASLTLNNGAKIRIVGEYASGSLTVTPAPLVNQPAVPDPLAFLDDSPMASQPVRSTSRIVLSNTTAVLEPGIYQGGIELRNSSIALLRPGIYVLDGGGLNVGSQASFCSISATSTATDCTTWASECSDANCGVLLYNSGSANGSGAMGAIDVGAGATLKLRAYDDRAHGGQYFDYRNVLIWQSATPAPSSTYAQPEVRLNGGGSVDIGGTLYAPSAAIHMGGGSGGSGGSTTLTVQFISWDLSIQGNASFHFRFSEQDFARPTDYGLVE